MCKCAYFSSFTYFCLCVRGVLVYLSLILGVRALSDSILVGGFRSGC